MSGESAAQRVAIAQLRRIVSLLIGCVVVLCVAVSCLAVHALVHDHDSHGTVLQQLIERVPL